MSVSNAEQVPVNIVGSNLYGIYPKISLETTWNMFVSDNWLINYAGYKKIAVPQPTGEGRGLFHSTRGNFLIAVIGSAVYRIGNNLAPIQIGIIDSTFGEVFIDENLAQQICIVDGQNAYIAAYDVATGLFPNPILKQTLSGGIIPGYVSYHNTFFLIASAPSSPNPQQWYVFVIDSADITGRTIKLNPVGNTFTLQTKPDRAVAVKRLPGSSNNVLVLGQTVAEVWQNVGGAQNYQRVSSYNIDEGCLSVSTIAASDDMICYLAQNENNAPCITITTGGQTKRISTDGIDNLLLTIKYPSNSTAFFYRQDGHLFYQLTFFNPADNLSLIHDFNTGQFFNVSDEKSNFYPARQVVYFGLKSYFISLKDSAIYQMGDEFTTYNYNLAANTLGEIIPRVRICKTIRKEDAATFRAGMFTFWLEQGLDNEYKVNNAASAVCSGLLTSESGDNLITEDDLQMISELGNCSTWQYKPRVDLSFSKNGNQSFSNTVSRDLNPLGHFRNQIRWHQLGMCNELTIQLRFIGYQRYCVSNGIIEVY